MTLWAGIAVLGLGIIVYVAGTISIVGTWDAFFIGVHKFKL